MAEKSIKLKLDVDSHKGTIQVKKTTDGLKKLGTTGVKAADKLSKGFVAAAAKMQLLVVGIAASTTAIGYMAKKTLDSADATAKLADSLGYNIKLMQEYSYAAGLSGVTQGTLNSSMLAFAKRLGEARAGTGALVTYLKKTDTALLNQLTSTSDVNKALEIFMTALGNVKDSTNRAALASAAFSRAGVAMTVMVKDGGAGLKAMQKEAHNLGLILGGGLFRNAELLNDSMSKVSQVIRILFTKAVLTLAPEIDKVVKKMVRWVSANQDLIDQKTEKGINAITGSFKTLVSTLEFIDKHFNKIKTGLEIIIGYKLTKWLLSGVAAFKQFGVYAGFAGTRVGLFTAGLVAATAELVLFVAAAWAAYYIIEKLGAERLRNWFGMPLEDAIEFRAELDKARGVGIELTGQAKELALALKDADKYYGSMEDRGKQLALALKDPDKFFVKGPDWLKEEEKLRAHITMLEELEKKIAKQRLERMIRDAESEIDLIIKKHEIYKAELKKSEEKKLQLKKDFNEAYAAIGKTQLQLDIEAAEAQAEIWRGAGFNRIEIKEWETAEITKLEKAAADKTEDLNAKLLGGIKSWAMNFSNTLNEMLWGAEVTFANIAKSFAKMITQMLIQESMLKLIGKAGVGGKAGSGILGALFPSEKGNVINNGAMMTYAKGGIVNSPTLFPMANGAGLMGEAGPEAILPLQRGKGGVLGVSGGGGTTINTEINISMDNSTTNPEDTKRAGRDIARAVEYEFNRNLVKNLRPGGILNQGV